MTDLTRDILAPIAPTTNKANAIMRAFNTGMAVFDGVRLGLKVMKIQELLWKDTDYCNP